MKQPKGVFRTALAAALALGALQAHAVVTFDAMGGELGVEGSLTSTVRARVGAGPAYVGQWLQRLQIEAGLNYDNVGIFDKLSFVTVVRPEYDIAMDTGEFSDGRIGDGATGHSRTDLHDFSFENDALGFGGFDFILGRGTNTTGGIGKNVQEGFTNAATLQKQFEVAFANAGDGTRTKNPAGFGANRSSFPLVVQKASNLHLDCAHCTDLNLDPIDVATGNTDSNGRLYPFRELYVDAVAGDFWFRVGKQQIVWGKTDFFRLQDIINPIDFGQHFFFDSFEDIRIPQWMASAQWKFGSFGPLTDNALQVVWNFDRFQGVGLGNPSQFWAHPFAKDISTFAIFNTYFSVEPCVSSDTAFGGNRSGLNSRHTKFAASDVCGALGPNDKRMPSGFGQPVGLSANNRPEYSIENTEAGLRWEFRVSDWRVAISHWYGWNDVPVFKFHSVNLPTRYVNGVLPNDVLIGDLNALRQDITTVNGKPDESPLTFAKRQIKKGNLVPFGTTGACVGCTGHAVNNTGAFGGAVLAGVNDPVLVTTPQNAAKLLAKRANDPALRLAAKQALASGNYQPLWSGTNPTLKGAKGAKGGSYAPFANCGREIGGTFCSPLAGGQTSEEYKQAHTLGLSFDYFEQYTGTVWRVESSWTFKELVANTNQADWVGNSDVMRWSIGIDRPTFLKWLNKDRTFFLSWQLFDTWYMDHEGDAHTGMLNDTHNFITTFFFIGNYMRDRLKPVGFIVWEEASNSWVAGLNLEWLMDNHWSVKGGFHTILGGTNNNTHDTGPFTNFIAADSSFVQNPYVNAPFGIAHQGLGAVRSYDEIFFELKYQF